MNVRELQSRFLSSVYSYQGLFFLSLSSRERELLSPSETSTMNPHQALAIAQIVFYAPVVPIAFYVGIRAWKYGPRMAWYPPMPFALGMWLSRLDLYIFCDVRADGVR